jgi:hypothetical protein
MQEIPIGTWIRIAGREIVKCAIKNCRQVRRWICEFDPTRGLWKVVR